MAKSGYPGTCLSAYCGRIVCDGCPVRPTLVAWHRRQGTEAEYEAGQVRARALEARLDAEREGR